MNIQKRGVPILCVYKNGSSFRNEKGAWIVKVLAVCQKINKKLNFLKHCYDAIVKI